MASVDLTKAWRGAESAKPSDWRLKGVVCGPREIDPAIHSSEEWCAWARGPKGERVEGRGTGAQEALQQLAVRLKGLSEWPEHGHCEVLRP